MADVVTRVMIFCCIIGTTYVPVDTAVSVNANQETHHKTRARTQSELGVRSFQRVNLTREQILSYLEANGGDLAGLQKPSSEFIMELFNNLLSGQRLTEAAGHSDRRTRGKVLHSDTIRSFTASDTTECGRYHFRVPQLPKHEHLRMAELRIADDYKAGKRQKLTITARMDEQIVKVARITRKSRTKNNFDLTHALISLLNTHHGNLTIEVKDESKKQTTGVVTHAGNYVTSHKSIIVLYSRDNQFLKTVYSSFAARDHGVANNNQNAGSRHRRAASDITRKKNRRRRKKNKWNKNNSEICKLHDFKVNFDLIGWGPWIIHPKTFNAHVCWGECPSPIGHEFTPTNHAMLQSLMRMKRPMSAPELCCVATKLKPLSMLYFEYEDIVVRHHDGMVAAECGCR